jgi:glycosyltransferase involved in cell wall biosynthesis
MEYVVTQNQAQHDALKRNYRKESLIMPNIWIPSEQKKHEKEYDAIWVSNLRPLKRAEWFLEVANRHPQFRFCIVGGYLDKDYYSSIQQKSQEIPNLSFLGAKSFEEVNTLIAKSRLLVCTSEYEGFPNTFLQAWAQSVPVVSTVNPNNVFENHKLGVYVENVDSLCENTCTLLMDVQLYNDYMICIQNYFTENHSAVNGFVRLMNYMGFPN